MGSERVQFGQYELVKRIARGGMAEIFLAIERGAHGVTRQVVVKRVLPQMLESDDFVTMFMDEARLVAKLVHPNIASVHGFGDIDGIYYLVMEYVDGLTVSKLMRVMKDRRIPLPVALRLCADALAGLHYAHEVRDENGRPLGVVHRDISPQNIMVSKAGVAKLIDFGVAQAATQAHVTAAGQLKGKLAYMSPEQFRGKGIDRRADVFAVGAVLHEMVTGERLFLRENEAATMHALMFDEPPSVVPYGAPPELDLIIRKAVQKSPVERFKTAMDFQQALEALMAQQQLVMTAFQVGQFVTAAMKQLEHLRAKVRVQQAAEAGVPDLTPTHVSYKDGKVSAPIPGHTPTPQDLLSSPTLPPELTSSPRAADDLLRTAPGVPSELGRSSTETPSVSTPSPASDVEGAPTKRRRGLLIAVALVLLLVGGGGLAAWVALGDRGDDEGGSTTASIGGTATAPDAGSAPEVAPQPIPESEQAPVPVPIPDLPAHDAGPTKADASAAAPEAGVSGSPPDAAPRTKVRVARGTLFVNSTPWSKVRIGGRNLGNTPIVGAKVPVGTHRLILIDPNGERHTRRVTIRANEATKIFVNLRSGPSL